MSEAVDMVYEDEFEEAASFLKGIAGKLETKDLLYFYARFKQVTVGPNKTEKPGMFDFKGKQKWAAWNDLGEMTRDVAIAEYVDKLTEIDPDWREKESEDPENASWTSVSTMVAPEENQLSDEEKSIFDWIKEKNCDKFRQHFEAIDDVDGIKDENGLGLIHWAADRGCDDILSIILRSSKVDVNLKDSEGQTALHYASCCGHLDIVKRLLEAGADSKLTDDDGCKAEDSAATEEIANLLKNR